MVKIVVIGDVMMDMFVYGTVSRLNPEAPVPILDTQKIELALGGAANTANNVKSLNGEVYLFGYVANDFQGSWIKEERRKQGIKGKLFKTEQTTLKIRFGSPQMLRVDTEKKVKKTFDDEIIKRIKRINPKIIVISDYAKGAITQGLFNKLKKLKIRIIVDPKDKINYLGCYLIVPNLREYQRLVKKPKNILITKGADGMSLGKKHFPTEAKEVYDVIGAGDTVIAALAVKLAQGEKLEDAIIFANKLAGEVVSKKGTSVVGKK